MKIISFIVALSFSLLSQTASSQASDKDAKAAELNIKIANLIIDGKGKVGKDISIPNSIDIAWELESKQKQPQLAWNLSALIFSQNLNISSDQKWLLLNVLVESAIKINKIQTTNRTYLMVIDALKSEEGKSEFTFLVIKKTNELAEKSLLSNRFDLLSNYSYFLLKNSKAGKLNFQEQELEITWALDKFYQINVWTDREQNSAKMYEQEARRYNLVKDYLNYLKNSGFSQDQNLFLAATIIHSVVYHESFNNAKALVSLAEPFLYIDAGNQEALFRQILALTALLPRDDYYLGGKKPEELMGYIEKASTKSSSPESKFMTGMVLGNVYSEGGKFDKADAQFQIALKNIDPKNEMPDVARGLRLVINGLQLKSLYARGDLSQVIQITPAIYSEMNWYFGGFLKKYPQMVSMAGGFSIMIEVQTFLGNYREATAIGEKILAALESGRREGRDINAGIIITADQLATAYEKSGDIKRAEVLRKIKFDAEAEDDLKSIERNTQFMARESDIRSYKSFIKLSRELIGNLKKSDEKRRHFLMQENCNNLLDIFESQITEVKNTGNARMYLDSLGYLFTLASCGGDQAYAGYISKLYVNTLQGLRINLSDRQAQLGVFTAAQAETLKVFVNNFYEIGDYQAAQLTMRVLKENEFLDFLNTRTDKDLVLSKIEYSTLEREFNFKKDQIEKEIQSLQLSYNNAKDFKEQSLIQSTISEKFSKLKTLSGNFKQALQKSYANTEVKRDYGAVKLKANEAQLDYVIEKNKISLYVYTSKNTKSYSFEVSRESLRSQILELNLALTKKQMPKSGLIALLSKELMIDKINLLKDENIKTLKIRSDDLLPVIPLALMTGNKGALGENFNLIFLGLGKNESSLDLGDSMVAFGVTKSYQQYSALPYVREEILGLQEMTLPKGKNLSRKVFLDNAFTKSALVSSFDKGDSYLHIATHYSVPGSRNNAGQLLLGDGSTFSLTDIRNEIKTNNKVQLVTLSACDTGVINKADSSSNLEGLSNVLNLKGAKAVMGTLWPISDEATALFMKLFYGLIFKGGYSPEEALKLTQSAFSRGSLSAIKDGPAMIDGNSQEFDAKLKKYTNPFYWAAFQIVGS